MGGASSRDLTSQLKKAKSSSMDVRAVEQLYARSTSFLKYDTKASAATKEQVRTLVNDLVRMLNSSYDSFIREKADHSTCIELEIVGLNRTTMCYNLADLQQHWRAQQLKWVNEAARGEYHSVYTIPNVEDAVILKDDVERVLRYYATPHRPPAIKWFVMPRPLPRAQVRDADMEATAARTLCTLAPSSDPGVVKRQLEAEDRLRKLRPLRKLTGGAHRRRQRPAQA